jgi:hypothetical protein
MNRQNFTFQNPWDIAVVALTEMLKEHPSLDRCKIQLESCSPFVLAVICPQSHAREAWANRCFLVARSVQLGFQGRIVFKIETSQVRIGSTVISKENAEALLTEFSSSSLLPQWFSSEEIHAAIAYEEKPALIFSLKPTHLELVLFNKATEGCFIENIEQLTPALIALVSEQGSWCTKIPNCELTVLGLPRYVVDLEKIFVPDFGGFVWWLTVV